MEVDKKHIIISRFLFFLGVFVFSISLILPENFRNISLFCFALVCPLLVFKSNWRNRFSWLLFVNTFFFLTQLVSVSYSSDIDYAYLRILAMIALVVIPLCFYFVSSKGIISLEKMEIKLSIVFYGSIVLFFVGVLIQNYFNDHLNEFIFRDYSERLNSKYGKYSMHPIYASLYLSISFLLALNIYPRIKKIRHKIIFFLSLFFLILILFLLARKSIIFVTIIVFLIYFLKQRKKKEIIIFLLLVLVLSIISYFIPPIKQRYIEFLNSMAVTSQQTNSIGSTLIRLNIYDFSIEAIQQKPWLGYGIGDTKEILKQYYATKPEIFNGNYYNSHNQFLSAWLTSGIIGFLSLIIMMFFNFRLAIKRNDFIFLAILLIFTIALLTENILERQNGVILFSFFINFFAFKNLQQKTNP